FQMETIVQGTIGALGYLEDGVYYPEPDCIETVRDLIRFLRADGPDLMVRRCCGSHNVVGSDLIPILKTPKLKDDMFDLTLRLAANLCQPSMVSLQGKTPETKEQVAMQRQLEDNLTRTKLACADRGLFDVLKAKLSRFFIETDWDSRTEEQRLVMERIVVFIRYMFSITPIGIDDKRTAFDTSSHDRLVEAAIDSGLDVLLMEISKDRRERDFHLSILEIFALMLKEHKPEDLVSADQGRSEEEKRKTEVELQQIVENQRAAMEEMKRKIMGKRHTNFTGSYEVRGLTAPISGNDRIIINKPVKDVTALEFNETRKAKKRTPKNRRPFEANQRTFLSSMEIRLKMKGFVTRLLEDCYVRLMRSTKTAAFDARRSIGQRQADLHYFLLERFCVQFARLAKMRAEKVSCSLGVDGFHHVQMQLDNYLELARVEKKDGRRFGLRAQFALSAYKELILFHQYMMDCGTADEKEVATSTCKHILRMDEYRDLSSKLMQGFMPGVLSKTFLRELVLVNHHYFRLLERSHKAGLLTHVTKKQRVRRNHGGRGRKSKKGGKKEGEEMGLIGGDDDAAQRAAEREANEKLDGMREATAEDMWDGLEEGVRAVLKGEEEEEADVRPIEVTLEVDDDVHQRFAMLRIQRALRSGRALTAVSLYHAARAIWPTDGAFGTATMPLEDEMNEIKAILVTDLKEVATELAEAEQKMEQSMAGRRGGGGGEEGEGEGEKEEYDSEAEDEDAR
ncbi:tim-1, partial [Pristionchus pacificus]